MLVNVFLCPATYASFQFHTTRRKQQPHTIKDCLFLAYVGVDLWDLMVIEANLFARQKLVGSLEHIAKFSPVTQGELKPSFCWRQHHHGHGKDSICCFILVFQ